MTIPVLNILIPDSHDTKLLTIADTSIYPEGFSVSSATLEITTPGYGPKQIPFYARNINVYNSDTLGITSSGSPVELPDGVYSIKYAIYPSFKYNIAKTFLRVDKLYSKFDEKFLNIDIFSCDTQLKKNDRMKLDEIEWYIQGAIASANRCANKLSMEMYRKANTLVDNLNKC